MPTRVLDVGSHRVRFGEAGEARPRVYEATPAGLVARGSIKDWDRLSSWLAAQASSSSSATSGSAGTGAGAGAGAGAGDEYVVALSPWDSDGAAARRKYAEVLFEKQGAAAVFLSPAAVLASFANARQTAVVVDMGATGCLASAVVDGWLSTVESSELGGAALDAWLAERAAAAQAQAQAQAGAGAGGSADAASAKRAKRSADASGEGAPPPVYSAEEARELRERGGAFRLPDGTPVLEDVSKACLALLVDPTPLDRPAEFTAVQELALTAATKGTGSELRKTLMGNVVVCGGLSRTPDAPERVARHLGRLSRLDQVRVIVGAEEDRPVGAWLGGSIVASLSSFAEFKVTKAEYDAGGYEAVRRKCP